MKIGRSRIWVSMALLLGIATMELGVPAGAAPGAPAALQGVGNASCFSPAPHGFSDVPTTSFANTAISWLVEAGITTGTTPTTFSPQANTTRADMAVFLWRNAGAPAPAGQQHFTDVPTTSYANTAIAWLVEAGITTGTTPTTFSPKPTSPAPKWPFSSGATTARTPTSATSPPSPETALEVSLMAPATPPNSTTRTGWRSPPTATSTSPTPSTNGFG
jgi:hypothetical protein